MTNGLHNWYDESRGVTHLNGGCIGGETTLCGLTYDEPAEFSDGPDMVPTNKPCTCPECLEFLDTLLPYLKIENKRLVSSRRKKRIQHEKE